MAKVKLYTRRLLKRHRRAQEAERAEERKAEAALKMVPRKWREHDKEMRRMAGGMDAAS